jgi:hypothetical protein
LLQDSDRTTLQVPSQPSLAVLRELLYGSAAHAHAQIVQTNRPSLHKLPAVLHYTKWRTW